MDIARSVLGFVPWTAFGAILLGFAASVFVMHSMWPVAAGAPGRKALLIIAHPDDEAMFFVPALKALQRAGWELCVLCLSNGSGGGDGAVRSREMLASAAVLEIAPTQVWVVDHPELQDGMQAVWPAEVVRRLVADKVTSTDAQMVLTFDARGISGHANHRAVHAGVKQFALSPAGGSVPCYELETVFVVRKFTSVFDVVLSAATTMLRLQEWRSGKGSPPAVFVTQHDPRLSDRVMKAHASQYVWFRKIFVLFSRHTFMNTLRLMNPATADE